MPLQIEERVKIKKTCSNHHFTKKVNFRFRRNSCVKYMCVQGPKDNVIRLYIMDNISVADDRIVPQFVHITQTQSCRCFDINRHFIEIMVRKLCLNQLRSTHKLV